MPTVRFPLGFNSVCFLEMIKRKWLDKMFLLKIKEKEKLRGLAGDIEGEGA